MRQHKLTLSLSVLVILMTNCDRSETASTKFTNLQCEMFESNFGSFPKCRLKLVKRGLTTANVHIKLLQVPVTNVMANLAFYKKANGFKPFLYNFTIDYCKYVKHKATNLVLTIIMGFITPYSNINHTCPYDHDIFIKGLILPEEKFRLLPLPAGEYMLKFLLGTNNEWKLTVKAFFLRTE